MWNEVTSENKKKRKRKGRREKKELPLPHSFKSMELFGLSLSKGGHDQQPSLCKEYEYLAHVPVPGQSSAFFFFFPFS